MSPLDVLLLALLTGSTAAGMVVAVRALPWVYKRMLEQKKPWSCDICMSFWTVALLTLGLGLTLQAWVVAGPAYPVALWVLRRLTDPRNPPPLPPLEE